MGKIMTTKPANAKRDLLTYEDYVTFPDNDGIRKEIIEGELFMTPAPSTLHQHILFKLAKLLDDHIIENELGTLLISPCDVIFSHINVFQPDILFVSKKNKSILTNLNVKGAPDLIVEILSPSTAETDRNFKKVIYEKFGVKEYWIVDPENETIEVWTLKGRKFELYIQAKKNQALKSKLMKNLKIKLTLIFARLTD